MNWNHLSFGEPSGPPDVPPGQTQGGGRQPAPEKPTKPADEEEETEGDE